MFVNKKSNLVKLMLCLMALLTTLFSYSVASATCPDKSVGTNYASPATTGTTTGGDNDVNTTCADVGVPDATISFTAPFDVEWTFDTLGSNFDTVLAVFDGSCLGDELGCNDDRIEGNSSSGSEVTLRVSTGQTVIIVIEGPSGTVTGNYVLNITPNCIPQCEGRECGDNGCGGVCGVCNDSNDCTADICNTDTGTCSSQNYATGTACEDGLFCTVNDTCDNGACISGGQIDCAVAMGDSNTCKSWTCNEATDHCDSESLPTGTDCEDGLFCTENDYCLNGQCVHGNDVDCSHLDTVCEVGVCDDEQNSCVVDAEQNNGNSCNDNNMCTQNDVCSSGQCSGVAVNCSVYDGQCTEGACDIVTGECYAKSANEGNTCNDDKFCTVNEKCTSGICGGGDPYDCSAQNSVDGCVVGQCNEAVDECIPTAVATGTLCNDGKFCTSGEKCVNGHCEGGTINDCAEFSGQCKSAYCDQVQDECVVDTQTYQGNTCSDGKNCTQNDVCDEGNCVGSLKSCPDVLCKVGVCDLDEDTCVYTPVENGQSCEDDLYCSVNTECIDGVCAGGAEKDCSHLDNDCNTGICNETLNKCETESESKENQQCSDGNNCTVGDKCIDGSCRSTPKNCSGVSDDCSVGTCDAETGDCYKVPIPNAEGLPCNDGSFCTVGEICSSGECVNGTPNTCPNTAHDEQCQSVECNEETDHCDVLAANEGSSCNDGLICFENETCQNGVCKGNSIDCTGVVTNSECEEGVCDENDGGCVAKAANQGGPCEDGLFCKDGSTCLDGICTGGTDKDCSGLVNEEQCQVGVCDEENDECKVQTANDGSECEDGLFCTVYETCSEGVCGNGSPRDCSGVVQDDQCQEEACDEVNDECAPSNLDNGTECDDLLNCTENDQCTDGACAGSAVDCSDGVDCTVDECDESQGCIYSLDDDYCDTDDDPCTAGVCDSENGCSIVQLEDWTVCAQTSTETSVCLDTVCTKIVSNDRCEGAAELSMGRPINTLINKYNASKNVTTPCSDVDYTGPDSFYKIAVVAQTDYKLTFSCSDEVEMNAFIWTGCEDTDICLALTEIDANSFEITYFLDGEQVTANGYIIIQVVAKAPLVGDVTGTYQFTFSKYSDEDGDADMELEEELEEEVELDAEDEIELEEEAEAETVEPACEAGAKECRGPFTVVVCSDDGSRWNIYEDCSLTSTNCVEGACESSDGDSDDDMELELETENNVDGDSVDGDMDQDVEIDEVIEEESSGCSQSQGCASLMLILLLGLVAIRRKLFA